MATDSADSPSVVSVAARAVPHDPPHWVAALGLAAALALVVSPFLDWLEIEPAQAERFGGALEKQAQAEGGTLRAQAWERIGARLAERHALTGLDVVSWSRAARTRIAVRDDEAAGQGANDALARGWSALSGAILAVGGAGLLLAGYLAVHRLGRYRIPMRILAGVAGAIALLLAAGLDWFCGGLVEAVRCAAGQKALLLGGAGLLGSVVASFTLRSVFGVLAGIALTLAALAALTWAWVEHGWLV